eukprot:gnl/MRDRNA2_/MRDRNA2_103792_c0_seq1.p1 gnl/MRDRNA2_/MRDRNA2_103792_c0~~gnl/MRDRNA2_/MRDRNA2_103792_c0_seq1.p1  ORF type:complete len:232 (+),score=67.94 gnl/MRDRNA2_/MRDRNA2_103792_c0_seq1:281-976(+)
MASIMEPQMPMELSESLFCQEMGQALMWFGCAFIGWVASSFLLEYLGCKKGVKASKSRAGSQAFRQEVALYTNKAGIGAAAQHFGLTEAEVEKHCAQFEKQQSPPNVSAETDNEEESQPAAEVTLCTARSTNAGHVLLEHYDVFQSCEGAWSGPLEEQAEVVEEEAEEEVEETQEEAQSTPKLAKNLTIPMSALQEVNAEEFFEGSDSISLWLVPEGHVYCNFSQRWVPET